MKFNNKFWVAMLKIDEKYYVVADNSGKAVNAFKNEKESINFFDYAYLKSNSSNISGYGSSLINALNTQPKIIEADLELLSTKLFDEKEGIKVYSLGTKAGFLNGFECNRNKTDVEKIYSSGKSPTYEFMK